MRSIFDMQAWQGNALELGCSCLISTLKDLEFNVRPHFPLHHALEPLNLAQHGQILQRQAGRLLPPRKRAILACPLRLQAPAPRRVLLPPLRPLRNARRRPLRRARKLVASPVPGPHKWRKPRSAGLGGENEERKTHDCYGG